MSGLKRLYNVAAMSPVPEHPVTRKNIRRDIYMLLAIAGFTVAMALFYWLYPGANPDPKPPENTSTGAGPESLTPPLSVVYSVSAKTDDSRTLKANYTPQGRE